MVTTVTTTTITTVTNVAAMGLVATLGIVAIGSLVVFLATKELAAASPSGSSIRVAKFVNVGIWPLTIVLGVLAGIKITEILII